MQVLILIVAGLLALGLPTSSPLSGKRRLWHPWIESGLFPIIVGMVTHVLAVPKAAHEEFALQWRPLLALALATAGVLVGTQLRMAYVHRAGKPFLLNQSYAACIQGLAVAGVLVLIFSFTTDWHPLMVLACVGMSAALAIASSQRPLLGCGNILRRDVVGKHIAPSGWWNLIALFVGSLSLQLGLMNTDTELIPWVEPRLQVLLVSVFLGLTLGRLTVGVKASGESSLFLLAILALSGGVALLFDGSPMLTGLIVGAVFANVALGRLAMIERQLADLEQPLVVVIGFLCGLLMPLETIQIWLWAIPAVVLCVRYAVRAFYCPTSPLIGDRMERALVPPGATGVLLLGSCVLAPGIGTELAVPVFVACTIALLVGEIYEVRYLRRGVLTAPTGRAL